MNEKTVTFITLDQLYEATCLDIVQKRIPYFKEMNWYEFCAEKKGYKYLHNRNGPALVNLKTGAKQYWINGELNQEHGKILEFDQALEDVFK